MTLDGGNSWEDLLSAARSGTLDESERALLLEHIAKCPHCRLAFDSIDDDASLDRGGPPRAMARESSARIRERLLVRAAADRPPDRRGRSSLDIAGFSGWAVAAGLGSLLLLHHGFHQPLGLGWVVAGGLGLGCVALALRLRAHSRKTSILAARVAMLENRAEAKSGTVPESTAR